MPNVTLVGQAGLQGWREKVAVRAAPATAERTPLEEDQVRALIGALFFLLSVLYIAKAIAAASREVRRES